MKLVVDIQSDSLADLAKAIRILERAKYNRENNKPLTEGFDELGVNASSSQKSSDSSGQLSRAAQEAKKQMELMGKIDLSTYFSKG
ncbi:MAG: hypothetical protein PHG05_02745 [Candidatus Nanoarchaeia archaeon]|nr:hypothetical protein [Candidatus Nanoarchaeia archaeon]